jgi:hypothetical protein
VVVKISFKMSSTFGSSRAVLKSSGAVVKTSCETCRIYLSQASRLRLGFRA